MKLEYNESTLSKLRVFNLVMGLLHLVQAVAMVLVSNDSKVTLYNTFLSFDPETEMMFLVPKEFGDLPLGYSVSVFLFISALAHLLIATVFYNKYKKDLGQGMNYMRWYEYSLSSSWMIAIIATLTGIFDAGFLLALFGLNASMIFFGLLMEKMNKGLEKKSIDWTAFIYGCFAGLIPWVILFWQFYGALDLIDSDVPDFVYGIIISLFLFFNVFAINMFLQYKGVGKWRNYLFGEVMYIVLSLLAKSALAWQVWSGTLRG